MTIEEMKAELEAAGNYRIERISDNGKEWLVAVKLTIEEDGYTWELVRELYKGDDPTIAYKVLEKDCIRKGYEHLQKERQFEAMKELLETLRDTAIDVTNNPHFGDELKWWAGGLKQTINEKMGWKDE
jgi:hypothetical protein